MKSLTIDAKIENLGSVTAFVEECLEELGCPMRVQMQMDVAVEEIFVNIAHYAYGEGTGEAVISVGAVENGIEVEFRDRGTPFNPLEKADPDVTLAAADRGIGGLGIYMVKKSMDQMTYEYTDGQNILRIMKKT